MCCFYLTRGILGLAMTPLLILLGPLSAQEVTEVPVEEDQERLDPIQNSDLLEDRWDFEQTFHASGEGLFTRDYQVTQWNAQYGHNYGEAAWDLGLTYNTYDIDLRSPDPFFSSSSSYDDRVGFQANVTQSLNERLTWQGIGGYYEGFQNFRSLWLHDYYKQIGSLPFFGGYPDVSPRGYQIGTQLRWEYLPATGYLEVNFGYYKDWIAPSAEFERVTILGRSVIDSFQYRVASENVLSSRVRSLLELNLTHTAARERRFGVQHSLNVALAERWVFRTRAGWVTENPGFEAFYAGGTIEHELSPSWLLSLFGRYYHDTGEIQNSLPSSNAPPGLDSYQIGLGLRWLGERSSIKVTGGPYLTRYEKADIEAPFFEDLYQSRDWASVQLAYSLNF